MKLVCKLRGNWLSEKRFEIGAVGDGREVEPHLKRTDEVHAATDFHHFFHIGRTTLHEIYRKQFPLSSKRKLEIKQSYGAHDL